MVVNIILAVASGSGIGIGEVIVWLATIFGALVIFFGLRVAAQLLRLLVRMEEHLGSLASGSRAAR